MVPRGANSCKKPKIVERHGQIRNQRTGDTKGGLRKRDRGSHYGQNPLLAIASYTGGAEMESPRRPASASSAMSSLSLGGNPRH
jgi:hypothetical protein